MRCRFALDLFAFRPGQQPLAAVVAGALELDERVGGDGPLPDAVVDRGLQNLDRQRAGGLGPTVCLGSGRHVRALEVGRSGPGTRLALT